jgi:probable addiction module antidote protein
MKPTFRPFDASEYLDNDEIIAEYLTVAAEDSNPDVFLAALGDVAKARGMTEIARESGLGRESLYKSLIAGAHPRHETIGAILKALGVKVRIVPDPVASRGLAEKRAAFTAKQRKRPKRATAKRKAKG